MEALIFESENKGNLDLIKELAQKLGISVRNADYIEENSRRERIKKMLKISDESVLPNDITMDEIVEEVRLARLERNKK